MSDNRQWLEELGLGQYADAFDENAIDARVISELTDVDLRELGVSVMGHRKLILKKIGEETDQRQPKPPADILEEARPESPQPPSPEAERR